MKRVLALSACLALGLGTSARADEKPPLEQALEAFAKGEYERAVELASQVPEDADDHPRARYLAGEAHLKLEQATEAERAFRAVLEARPRAVPAMVGLGRALEAQGKAEEAEKLYRDAIAADRKHADAKLALGELQMRQDKLGKARSTLRAAYRLAPGNPFCARALTEVLIRGGDVRGAEKVAKDFARARPDHPMGHFLRGLVLERRGKIEEAIASYEEAIALDERFLDAHKNLAILYQKKGFRNKAVEMWERSLRCSPDEKTRQEVKEQLIKLL